MARISGSSYKCVLVLTLGFLVFEIVVGQICRSLLIAVDSFHTLYVFINLALSEVRVLCMLRTTEGCVSNPSAS
uniref:Uncharacterized protein n=1 Tax=Sinocyclocheilus rhinocerous TaxID=307959 RepID=A0A673GF74_9TELE